MARGVTPANRLRIPSSAATFLRVPKVPPEGPLAPSDSCMRVFTTSCMHRQKLKGGVLVELGAVGALSTSLAADSWHCFAHNCIAEMGFDSFTIHRQELGQVVLVSTKLGVTCCCCICPEVR